jgi:hypothetical protein
MQPPAGAVGVLPEIERIELGEAGEAGGVVPEVSGHGAF